MSIPGVGHSADNSLRANTGCQIAGSPDRRTGRLARPGDGRPCSSGQGSLPQRHQGQVAPSDDGASAPPTAPPLIRHCRSSAARTGTRHRYAANGPTRFAGRAVSRTRAEPDTPCSDRRSQPELAQAQPGKPGWANRAMPSRAMPSRAGPSRAGPSRTGQAEPAKQVRSEQNRVKLRVMPSRTRPCKSGYAEPSHGGQAAGRAGFPSRAEPIRIDLILPSEVTPGWRTTPCRPRRSACPKPSATKPSETERSRSGKVRIGPIGAEPVRAGQVGAGPS